MRTRYLSLAYVLATRILSLFIRIWALIGACSPCNSLFLVSEHAMHPPITVYRRLFSQRRVVCFLLSISRCYIYYSDCAVLQKLRMHPLRKFYHLIYFCSRIALWTKVSSVVVSCCDVMYWCIVLLKCDTNFSILALYIGIAVCSCCKVFLMF